MRVHFLRWLIKDVAMVLTVTELSENLDGCLGWGVKVMSTMLASIVFCSCYTRVLFGVSGSLLMCFVTDPRKRYFTAPQQHHIVTNSRTSNFAVNIK